MIPTCAEKGCGAAARFVMYWPGATAFVCSACLARAIDGARALGFVLRFSKLTGDGHAD